MEGLLLKLQADVAARKGPRQELGPGLKPIGIVLVASVLAFQLGAHSAQAGVLGLGGSSRSKLSAELEAQRGAFDLQQIRIERLERAHRLSAEYGIAADLALSIEEIALAEGIDPAIAFELVRAESGFNPRAVSSVGAMGLTQLMPRTAEFLAPGISREEIFEREMNLRLGFRFFRSLVTYYRGDLRLALLAYNRGPTTVDRLLAVGEDPGNGYASAILGRSRAPSGNPSERR